MEINTDYPFQYFPNYLDCDGLKNKILQNIELDRGEIEIGRGDRKVIREEQRLTKWLSDNKSLTFEYSGKVMKPEPIPEFIKAIINKIYKDFGIIFDGVLVNYYPNSRAQMGYHSDPQDNKWDNNFIVLTIGQTRRFIFREISNKYKKKEFTFSEGDIIYMFDDCQKKYEHSVRKSTEENEDRISLVFKRSI